MLKIRMQGTLKDIHWFKGLMERHGEIKVKDVSKPFKNKGTNKNGQDALPTENKKVG